MARLLLLDYRLYAREPPPVDGARPLWTCGEVCTLAAGGQERRGTGAVPQQDTRAIDKSCHEPQCRRPGRRRSAVRYIARRKYGILCFERIDETPRPVATRRRYR